MLIGQADQYPPPMADNVEQRSARVDPAGHFRFEGVPSGSFQVQAVLGAMSSSDRVQVELESGERREDVRIVLASGARIFGRAVSSRGEALAAAYVRIVPVSGTQLGRFDYTGADGRFEFLGLEQRPYALAVIPVNGGANEGHRAMAAISPVVPSENELAVTVDDADLLEGLVLGVDGAAAPHAFVSAGFGGLGLDSDYCDEEGRFALHVPRDVPCDLHALTTIAPTDPDAGYRIRSEGPKAEMSGVVARGQRVELRLAE